MLGEVGAVGERLGALRTFVRLGFSHVDLRVELQVCLGAKNLKKKIEISFKRKKIFQEF